MADPTWVDGVTPLDAVNMTKLQTRDEKGAPAGYATLDAATKVPLAQIPTLDAGHIPDLSGTYQPLSQKNQPSGYLGLDSGMTAAAALFVSTQGGPASNSFQAAAAGDTAPRFIIQAAGSIYWGPGNGPADTDLYRGGATYLKTDSNFVAKGSIGVDEGGNGATGGLFFGANRDAGLYRLMGGYLKTDANLLVGSSLAVDHNASGVPLYFGSGADTNLYRGGPGVLQSNAKFKPASLVCQIKSGAPNDADVHGGSEAGAIVLDMANHKLWVRDADGWRGVAIA